MTKKEETTAIVEAENTAVTAVEENVKVEIDQADMMIPFLKVVQSLSEEVTPGKDKYNADVRPGDIYDGVTRTIFKGAKVVICGLKKYYAEWTPEVRGKLVGKHLANSPVVTGAKKVEKETEKGNKFYSLYTSAGNELIETYGVLMIVKTDDGLVLPGVLTLSKTSFVVGRQLSTQLVIRQGKGTPIFRLESSSTSNAKGSWFKPSFVFDSYETDADIISMANSVGSAIDSILLRNTDMDVTDNAADDNDLL